MRCLLFLFVMLEVFTLSKAQTTSVSNTVIMDYPIACDPPSGPAPAGKIWAGYPACTFICDPNAPPCTDGSARNADTCECPPIIACSMVFGCANVDESTCSCTACIDEICPDGSSRLLENTCQCPVIACAMMYGCATNDESTCACTSCIDESCWDRSVRSLDNDCQCPPEYACDPAWPFPPNKVWLGAPDCEFVCDSNLEACPRGEPRNPETCECRTPVCDPIWPPPVPANQWLPYPDCKWTCEPEKCPRKQKWNQKECKCTGRQKCHSV